MKGRLQLLTAIVVISLAATAAALAIEPIGQVQSVQGLVTAKGSEEAGRSLNVGSPVFLKDRVQTGPGAKVHIRFEDGSLVGQGEKAEFVIDEYMYNPNTREENATTLRLFKGVFRVITDKITKMNPEKFKVKTNYGTIGIRGCELVFKVLDDFEEVLVVGLHHADSVVIGIDETGQSRIVTEGYKGSLEVSEDGVAVSISLIDGLKQRRFSADEIAELNEATTPEAQTAKAPEEEDGVVQLGALEALDQINGVITEIPIGLEQPEAPVVEDEDVEEVVDEEEEPAGPSRIVGPRVTLASGSGSGWSWGVWSRDITDIDGLVRKTTTSYGAGAEGSEISATDFQAIADGAKLYNLSGTGSAGAVVTKGDKARVVEGSTDLNVRTGMGITPTWRGDFALSSPGGDSLNFNVDGTIAGGELKPGTLNSYSLQAFGSHGAGSLTRQDVGGALVGPGKGVDPITGAYVEFDFEHGDGPRVRGAGGADLK